MNPSVNRDRSWGRSLAARAKKQVRAVAASAATKVLYPQVLADGIRSSLQSSPAIPWNEIQRRR
jgi:hypothetical protein